VEQFIESTVRSFALHAPADTLLVFKHHPMDRGYKDYSRLISDLARETGMNSRLFYVHDQHLPTMLQYARGVVVINSTVGFSSLDHSTPIKVCGNAIYDLPGLAYQGKLDDFWRDAPHSKHDVTLHRNFRAKLISTTQLNGSFYRRMPNTGNCAGIVWGVPESN
jgi:capsular polysaccharide export protein